MPGRRPDRWKGHRQPVHPNEALTARIFEKTQHSLSEGAFAAIAWMRTLDDLRLPKGLSDAVLDDSGAVLASPAETCVTRAMRKNNATKRTAEFESVGIVTQQVSSGDRYGNVRLQVNTSQLAQLITERIAPYVQEIDGFRNSLTREERACVKASGAIDTGFQLVFLQDFFGLLESHSVQGLVGTAAKYQAKMQSAPPSVRPIGPGSPGSRGGRTDHIDIGHFQDEGPER